MKRKQSKGGSDAQHAKSDGMLDVGGGPLEASPKKKKKKKQQTKSKEEKHSARQSLDVS